MNEPRLAAIGDEDVGRRHVAMNDRARAARDRVRVKRRETRKRVEHDAKRNVKRYLVALRSRRAPELVETHTQRELRRAVQVAVEEQRVDRRNEVRMPDATRGARLGEERLFHFDVARESALDARELDDARAGARAAHLRDHERHESLVLQMQQDLVATNAGERARGLAFHGLLSNSRTQP
jgi:hypothetical protein